MLRRFISYYKPYRAMFFFDLFCALCISLVDLVYPMISRHVLNDLLPQSAFTAFFVWMAVLVGAYLLKGVFQFIVTYWGHMLGVNMEIDMRRDLFAHLQTLPFSFYDTQRTGSLMSRVVGDLFEVVELAHHGPEDLFISVITLTGSLIVMFTLQWRLALVIALLVPLVAGFTVYRRRHMAEASRQVKEKLAVINSGIESSISGVRTATAFANEGYERQRFAAGSESYRTARRGFYRQMAIFGAGNDVLTNLLNVAVIAAGGLLIIAGRLDQVDLLVFTMYIASFLTPIRKLANFMEQYSTGMAGFTRFQELMAVQPDIKDAPDAAPLTCRGGHIVLDRVSFGYGKAEREVLHDLSLDIPAGKTVALVGPSGGGKTTLCHLIPRFYDVDGGSITIDGQDIRQVTLHSLRGQIGIVQQDVTIFAATVRENIRYGRLDATDEEVVAAARMAEIHDAIMDMPEGYDTFVGERGIKLSGGQKQRISIARIFLKNPPILLLDEATSALDTVTEAHIQSALERLSRGRTTLVVAHRLSTVRGADMIAYVDHGRIDELGTHDELMRKGGRYAALNAPQLMQADALRP